MTQRKAERLMNLTILLLTARHPVTKEQIREATEPYRIVGDEAFEKMFERDKDELRRSGVPVEVAPLDAYFSDETGYRIRRQAYELPQIQFTAAEAALLGLAAEVWQSAGLAEETAAALRKLRAVGVEVDREALDDVAPRVVASEPSFSPMWEATMSRTLVEFDYRRPGQSEPQRRRLRPYRVISSRERWYVVGHDVDRDEPRMFRLSRVVGEVRPLGRPEAYEIPDGVDLEALTRRLLPPSRQGEAMVLVRQGHGQALRRSALQTQDGVRGPDGREDWARLHLPLYAEDTMADAVLALADSAVVESPQSLRESVVARLRSLIGAAS